MSRTARRVGPTRVIPRHVALLRGINVGRAKRVAMDDLRALVEGLGCQDVRTLLNSGNVVFTAPVEGARGIAARIESALSTELGVSSAVTVLSSVELDAIVAGNPFLDVANQPSRLMVTITRTAADCRRLAPVAQEEWAPERMAAGSRAVYLWCPDGIIASPVFNAVARLLGDAMTTRNWSTILKLQALATQRP